jgi:hypothetical protein
MERHTTANTAGNTLTIQSGGATSGATDKDGGDLILSSGIATGNGASSIVFKANGKGASGTASRTSFEMMRVNGYGVSFSGANAVTGDSSVAIGPGSTASGDWGALAVGDSATASAGWSAAIGWTATAGNQHAYAFGSGTSVSGYKSMALGYAVEAYNLLCLSLLL